jgi:hypothetical protein
MTTRVLGGLLAAAVAVGILVGAAGTIVIRDATRPSAAFADGMVDHMDDVGAPMSMMGTSMMGTSMMGEGWPMPVPSR